MKAGHLNESVTLYEGSALDVLPLLTGVDALVTDPPYGINLGVTNDRRQDGNHLGKRGYRSHCDSFEAFVADIVPCLNAAIDIATRAAVFTGPNIHEQRKPSSIGGVYCPAAIGRSYWGFKNFLPVLFYGTAPDMAKGSYPTVYKSSSTAEKNGHPCPKPLDWMRWLVGLASRRGDTILDCFAGSGTTGALAMLEGRRCILIEKDPVYCDVIRRRIERATGDGPGSLFHAKPAAHDLFTTTETP